MRLTRQGVRDLNPKQRNGRHRRQSVGCFHVFRHSPHCGCLGDFMWPIEEPCDVVCVKCGIERGGRWR